MAVRSKKAEENIRLLTEKTNKIFFTVSILLRGSRVASGGRMLPRVASEGRMLPRVTSGGHGLHQGVKSSLGGYRWPCGFADGLGGCEWLCVVMGGYCGSLVASGDTVEGGRGKH
jgi:hypothetical protein